MATRFAPKPSILSGEPTPTALEGWINNLIFNLTIDGNFEEFLEEDFRWSPPSVANRGLVDDPEDAGRNKRTAKQKAAYLNLMLGSIHSYAPVISKRFITEEATSLNEIWARLRTRFGCRKTGSSILELTSLALEANESFEALWERVLSFVEGNLLNPNDDITHLGAEIDRAEVMTPTLVNICIVTWLRIIHPGLPSIIKQKYATELRNKTLASIRDEISESLPSLLLEISGSEDQVAVSRLYKPYNSRQSKPSKFTKPKVKAFRKSCVICQTAKRPANHFLSDCPFLPDEDRRYMKSRTRVVDAYDDEEESNDEYEQSEDEYHNRRVDEDPNNRRVDIEASPEINILCNDMPVKAVLDSGAESNLIAERCARRLNCKVLQTRATARQADGTSRLKIVGEVHTVFERYPHKFAFNGLVVQDLKDDVVAGIPFLNSNDIYVRPAKKTIYIGDKEVIKYDPARRMAVPNNRNVSVILRVPQQTALLPGETVSFCLPSELEGEHHVAIEPRLISPSLSQNNFGKPWLKPQILPSSNNRIVLTNEGCQPVLLKKHEQIANIRYVENTDEMLPNNTPVPKSTLPPIKPNTSQLTNPTAQLPISSLSDAYKSVQIDPNNKHTATLKRKFEQLHQMHQRVFDDKTLGCYNGYSGKMEVKVNMGPTLPKQRKGRMPLYNRKQQNEYQEICDSLEGSVLVKPEEAGICVEYLNPSFLVRKPSGKKRLVTSFGEVAKYSKPQPALMPDSNQVLRSIANWKYLVKTDLTSAYWQMPLAKESMKFCGIVTPFKGIRVYARGAMGMPGTETALEEMLSRVLGTLITDGGVVKLADDLMVGGSTPEEVLEVWAKVLEELDKNGLKLSASKTICLPQSVMLLGWIWREGTIQASPHKISALEAVEPPPTIAKLRSFVGAYKFLSKVIPSYSDVLSPLEDEIAGKSGSEKVIWSDSLMNSFKRAQQQLSNSKIITLPRTGDNLQIITDASKTGIAATLYVIRNNKPLIAGFFNAKLRKHQISWIPCELEALCISSAVKHFAADITNSQNPVIIMTDSRPCIQSYEKLCRGQFSTSARVATFLSTISRYPVKLLHIKGAHNILADYASRNPIDCNSAECQVCKFIQESEESVIRTLTIKDILESNIPVPFSSRKSWHAMQQACYDLRRTAAHLHQGTTPSKKETKIKDVKKYLQYTSLAKDGVVVVSHQIPLGASIERIVIPRMYLHGLLTCLHLKLNHPSKLQMRKVFDRAFFALEIDVAIQEVCNNCHTCLALRDMPCTFMEQSTSPPKFIGSNFSVDILKRSGQCILVLRENVTSFTMAKIVKDEKGETLKEGLVILLSPLRSSNGPKVNVRVDPASGWRLVDSCKSLEKNGIHIEIGYEKNKNKNPVVDKAIRELHPEINKIDPSGGKISELTLSLALSNLNDRIRESGLSARELWTKRDQYTGKQIPLSEESVVRNKYQERLASHSASAKYQSRGKTEPCYSNISIGDLVYIISDRDKTKPREKYIVVKPKESNPRPNTVTLQKFVGSQLRSRIYTVNAANVMKIPSNLPSLSSPVSDSEDEDSYDFKMREESSDENKDQENSEANEQEAEADETVPAPASPPRQLPRRSARNHRLPSHLEDYVVARCN